jgi:hypothetical protein
MNKKHFAVLIFVSFIGGIVGGALSNQFLSGNVYAKSKATPNETIPDVIKTKELIIIDDKGNMAGTFNNQGISINDKEQSMKLNSFGLQMEFTSDRQKTITMISPFGFSFREYSPSEIFKLKQDKLSFLSDIFSDNKSIWIGSDPESKSGAIRMFDDNYKLRLVLGGVQLSNKKEETIQRPPSSIVMFNDKGNVIWEAP